VDQVGSRLLFRGYGVSNGQAALHAGLVGTDSLIILDEAHLSQPFVETLQGIRSYQNKDKRWGPKAPELPFHVVRMTATPRPGEQPFTLDHDDRANEELRRRLNASKIARLSEVKSVDANEAANQEGFCQIAVEAAVELRQECVSESGLKTPNPVIGVVFNRVGTAR